MQNMRRDERPFASRFKGPKESPGFTLWKVSNAWQRAIRAALAPLGVTHAQFVLLATAAWHSSKDGKPLSQRQLSERSGVDVMTTSQVVRALEEAGLVERSVHADDPRARAITVTAEGLAIVRRAIVVVEDVDEKFFAPLGTKTTGFLEAMHSLIESE